MAEGFDDTQLGRLAIPVEFDLSKSGEKLKRDARKVGQETGRLTAEEIRRAEAEWDKRYGGKSAEEMAKNTVRELRTQYKARVGEARAALIEGVIDRKEFERRAREAAQATNAVLLREMQAVGKGSAEFGVLSQGLVDVEKGAKKGAAGVGEMRESFASLLAQAAGVHPVLGRIVNVMGGMALGSIVMGGVLAALSALAFGWQKVTERTREARKETEEQIERLEELRRQRALGPGGQVAADAAAEAARRARLLIELERSREFRDADPARRRQITEAGGRPRSVEDVEADIAKIDARLEDAWGEMSENEEERSKQLADREASNLAALISANQARASEIARAREIIQEEYARLAELAEDDVEARAEALSRIRQLEGAFESAGAPAKREREKREREAEQAAKRLESLEADVQRRLAALTASGTDDLLLQIDRMEAEARDAAAQAGKEISQEFLDALDLLRTDARGAGALEGWQEQLRQIMRGDRGPEQQGALEGFVASMRKEVATLREGSKLRAQYQELLERAEDLHKQNAQAIQKETEAEAKRKATQSARDRAEELRDLRDRARLLEENARAAVQLANAIGLISDETMSALENIAQLGSSVFRVASGDLSAIPSVIGSVAQLAKSIFGGEDAEKLRREMVENARRLAENTQALREFAQAALSGVTGAERQAMIEFWTQVISGNAKSGWGQVVASQGATAGIEKLAAGSGRSFEDIVAFLEKLEKLTGTEFFDLEKNTLDLDEMTRAWQAFMDKGLGAFDETIGGIVDMLHFKWQMLGEGAGSAADRLQEFIDAIEDFQGAEGFADALREAMADGGVEGAKALLAEWTRLLASGDQSIFSEGGIFAGLSAEQVRQLLKEGNRLLEDVLRSGPGGTTQDFVQARSITELTGTRIEGALYSLEAMAARRNQLLELIAARVGGDLSGFQVSPSAWAPPISGGAGALSIENNFDIRVDGGASDGITVSAQVQAGVKDALAEVFSPSGLKRIDRGLGQIRTQKLRAAGRTS